MSFYYIPVMTVIILFQAVLVYCLLVKVARLEDKICRMTSISGAIKKGD